MKIINQKWESQTSLPSSARRWWITHSIFASDAPAETVDDVPDDLCFAYPTGTSDLCSPNLLAKGGGIRGRELKHKDGTSGLHQKENHATLWAIQDGHDKIIRICIKSYLNRDKAQEHEYPFSLSLQYSRHFCGELLIAKHAVLTAAHRQDRECKIALQGHDVLGGGQFIKVDCKVPHTYYNDDTAYQFIMISWLHF